MEQWGHQHRAFVVETFLKNGESVIVTQRKFRLHFNVPRHGRIPSRNTILLWVHNFRTTASAMKKHGVSKRTVRTPENSCTDSLQVMAGSSADTIPTTSDSTYGVGHVKVEENVDVMEENFIFIKDEADLGIKQEEISVDIPFPGIKSEPDESCTDPLHLLPSSSSETFPTSSDCTRDVGNTKVEEDVEVIECFMGIKKEADTAIKQEEIPEDITSPDIQPEHDKAASNGRAGQQDTGKKRQDTWTGERPYRCDVCNKTFSKTGNLKVHQRVHTGERPYRCDVCNKLFRNTGDLKVHQSVHTGERPYRCDVCNKIFSKTGNLKVHQRVHTGERPYRCDVCNKTFRNTCNLKEHQRVHTGERPYRCDVCNKTFSKTGTLKVHQHVHTGERPYRCDMCNKTFRNTGNLKEHQRVHTGERPYRCDLCNKTFSHKPALKKHLLSCCNQHP